MQYSSVVSASAPASQFLHCLNFHPDFIQWWMIMWKCKEIILSFPNVLGFFFVVLFLLLLFVCLFLFCFLSWSFIEAVETLTKTVDMISSMVIFCWSVQTTIFLRVHEYISLFSFNYLIFFLWCGMKIHVFGEVKKYLKYNWKLHKFKEIALTDT